MINTHALMDGVRKYVLSGALPGLRNVVFEDGEDQQPRTDGTTIYLPIPPATMTEEGKWLWLYKAEHEMGHEDEVNSQPHWKEVMVRERANGHTSPLLWHVANLLSDFVQEHNRLGRMVGRDQVLLRGRAVFLNAMVFNRPIAGEGLVSALFLHDSIQRQRRNPHIDVTTVIIDAEQTEFLKKVEALVDWHALKNEDDVFDAALKIWELLPKEDSEDKKEREAADRERSSFSEKSVSHHTSEEEKLVESTVTPSVYGEGRGVYNARIPITDITGINVHGVGLESYKDSLKKDLAYEGAQGDRNLANKVRAYFLGNRAVKSSTGYTSGRLDTNRLTDVIRGRRDVFRRREDSRVVDTAVSLLVDCSGSMYGAKYALAILAAERLAQSLGGIKCDVEIAGFSEIPYGDGTAVAHPIWKPFGRRYVASEVRKNAVDSMAVMSNNSDGENLLFAYHRLLKQDRTKRVLIVLSDGSPAGCGSEGSTMYMGDFAKQVAKMVEADKRVTLWGIGIMDRAVKDIYRNNVTIRDAHQLDSVLLDLVKKEIVI